MKLFFRIIVKIFLILTILIGCETAEQINETDPVALLKAGKAFGKKGQYDQSIVYFNKAIEIEPKFAEAYFNRGFAYQEKGQYDKAIPDYNKAIEINPRHDAVYNNRGNAYAARGKYDKAIADYTEAIELNPMDAVAYFNRGNTYAEVKGQYDKAISDFNRAIEINPMDAEAYNNTAWIFATCPNAIYRDGAKAVELAKKAVELDPKAIYLDTLATAYAEVGNFEGAITTQEKVIDLLKKEGQPKNLINQGIEHLKFYKAHKPWREK